MIRAREHPYVFFWVAKPSGRRASTGRVVKARRKGVADGTLGVVKGRLFRRRSVLRTFGGAAHNKQSLSHDPTRSRTRTHLRESSPAA